MTALTANHQLFYKNMQITIHFSVILYCLRSCFKKCQTGPSEETQADSIGLVTLIFS
eukprot:m.102783 g.102783  ORF g.102783 m.102783 type:complete len:57 (+) comp37183_c1_seq6:771-941(+)